MATGDDDIDFFGTTERERFIRHVDVRKRLHELAFSLSMHFLLICHPRQSMNPTEEIGMHMLKGSSSIKQYADNVIIIHRCARTDNAPDSNKVKIKVAKNRMFGIEGNTYLFYEPMWDGYTELKKVF